MAGWPFRWPFSEAFVRENCSHPPLAGAGCLISATEAKASPAFAARPTAALEKRFESSPIWIQEAITSRQQRPFQFANPQPFSPLAPDPIRLPLRNDFLCGNTNPLCDEVRP